MRRLREYTGVSQPYMSCMLCLAVWDVKDFLVQPSMHLLRKRGCERCGCGGLRVVLLRGFDRSMTRRTSSVMRHVAGKTSCHCGLMDNNGYPCFVRTDQICRKL